MAQISKRLVVKKEIPMDNSKDLVNSLDIALAEYHCTQKDYEKGLKIYREILPQLVDYQERMSTLHKYIDFSLQYAQSMTKDKKWVEAVEIYRDIMKYSGFPINVYKNIGLCMKSLGNADLAIKFLKRFEEISPDKEDVYVYLADITYSDIKKVMNIRLSHITVDNKNIFTLFSHRYSHIKSCCTLTFCRHTACYNRNFILIRRKSKYKVCSGSLISFSDNELSFII